jgi:hypothetical protein
MQQDLNRVIEQVSKEKGIDKSILIAALETAMVSAAKKTFGHQRKIEAQFNQEIGEVELFEAKTVVESVTDAAVEVSLDEAKENLDPDAEIGAGSPRPHARFRDAHHADSGVARVRSRADAQGLRRPRSPCSSSRDGVPSVTCSIHGIQEEVTRALRLCNVCR